MIWLYETFLAVASRFGANLMQYHVDIALTTASRGTMDRGERSPK